VNFSPLLTLYLIFIFVLGVVAILPSKNDLVSKIKTYFKWNFIFGIFLFTFQEELLYVALQYETYNVATDSALDIIGMILAVFTFIHLIGMFAHYVYQIVWKYTPTDEN